MTPEYLNQLADKADPDRLWRLKWGDQEKLSHEQRQQLDTGVALRRHASHVARLLEILEQGKSLLITPLSPNGSASKTVDTPADHAKLRHV